MKNRHLHHPTPSPLSYLSWESLAPGNILRSNLRQPVAPAHLPIFKTANLALTSVPLQAANWWCQLSLMGNSLAVVHSVEEASATWKSLQKKCWGETPIVAWTEKAMCHSHVILIYWPSHAEEAHLHQGQRLPGSHCQRCSRMCQRLRSVMSWQRLRRLCLHMLQAKNVRWVPCT